MKVYAAIFIATLTMPMASLAGILAMELGYVWSIRQAFGVGVLVGSVMVMLAVIIFLLGIPTLKRNFRS
ncbi:hypothetical protein ATI02_6060 [Pseudomonas baetica]|jgi:alanine dehydrogenase|uniref:Uncharacterized protein n=1 Tax=Pseudomonas baetica TaxID=674054 RepID=A0ABX4Q842_9PSED|nr:hypothetical protein [Pseudomonas baetica]PKA72953.1 hypothetical protein ATI02_6060 [Pseudomonas baetica]PTC19099.1 hypothetical protein C0J26_11735 [Pseudomonas baetica]